MLAINQDTKIGRYWDYPSENIDDNTLEEVKIIVEYQKKIYQKVLDGEWTEEEYYSFLSDIKKHRVMDFIQFQEVYNLFAELSSAEALKEIDNLLNKKLIFPNPKNKYVSQTILETIVAIRGKVFSFPNAPITEEEKGPFMSIDKEIELYGQILEQLQDPTSSYYEVLTGSYKDWVDGTFQNEELKKILIAKTEKVVEIKERNVKKALRKNITYQAKSKNVIDNYHSAHVKEIKRKQFIKNK